MKITIFTGTSFGLLAVIALLASFAAPVAVASGQTYIVSGTACHAITPNQAKFMEWRETGLVNQDTARDLFVVCPIMKFGDAEDFSVTIGLYNETNEDVDVSCTIREYLDGDRVDRQTSPDITVPADSFSSDMVFSGGFQTDTHANVVCQLPNGIAIESVRSSTEVPPDNGGGGSGEVVTPVDPISYRNDFEADDLNGWSAYINAFEVDCATTLGYGYAYYAIGTQVAQIATGEESKVVNVFSNYDDANLRSGDDASDPGICIETNFYRESTLTADQIGTYTFSYLVEEPPADADGNSLTGTNVSGFIKVLDPQAGFANIGGIAPVPSEPGTQSISITLTEEMVGKLLQYGFTTVAANFEPSGMYYDNLVFETPAQP